MTNKKHRSPSREPLDSKICVIKQAPLEHSQGMPPPLYNLILHITTPHLFRFPDNFTMMKTDQISGTNLILKKHEPNFCFFI